MEHNGIRVEFIGHIGLSSLRSVFINRSPPVELFHDRGSHSEFLALKKEVAEPGELKYTVSYDFEFRNVEKQFESYFGSNVRLR